MSKSIPFGLSEFEARVKPSPIQRRWILPTAAYAALLPFADVLNGACEYFAGSTFSIAIACKAALFAFIAWRLLQGVKLDINDFLWFICPVLALLGLAVFNSLRHGGGTANIIPLLRGPALMAAAYLALRLQDRRQAAVCAETYARCFWWVACVTLITTNLLNLGFKTYHGLGSKGFFIAGNEITVAFAAATVMMLILFDKSWTAIIIHGLLAGYALLILATKAGWMILAICLAWQLARKTLRLRAAATAALAGGAAIGILFGRDILFALGTRYLSSWQVLHKSINERGLWRGLLSGRDTLIENAMEIAGNMGITDWLLGMGCGNFSRVMAEKMAIPGMSHKMIEMDLPDMVMSCGIIAVLWYYGILLFHFSRGMTASEKSSDKTAVILLSLMVCSIVCGHVAFAATPSIMVGISLWMLSKPRSTNTDRQANAAEPS